MSVKPIIFSGPMVRALLAGTKTQTRRLIKPRGKHPSLFDGNWSDSYVLDPGNASWRERDIPYAPGDLLYVREAHYRTDNGHEEFAVYACDEGDVAEHLESVRTTKERYKLSDEWLAPHIRLRPSIHMPKWASRITLPVADVRAQRLQDISAEDAIAEGIDQWMTVGEARASGGLAWGDIPEDAPDDAIFWIADYDQKLAEDADRAVTLDPREAYRSLWNSLHGPDAWSENPWIAAYTFSVHHCNVDDLLRQRAAA
jgi:hypothetical protein